MAARRGRLATRRASQSRGFAHGFIDRHEKDAAPGPTPRPTSMARFIITTSSRPRSSAAQSAIYTTMAFIIDARSPAVTRYARYAHRPAIRTTPSLSSSLLPLQREPAKTHRDEAAGHENSGRCHMPIAFFSRHARYARPLLTSSHFHNFQQRTRGALSPRQHISSIELIHLRNGPGAKMKNVFSTPIRLADIFDAAVTAMMRLPADSADGE